MTEKLIEWRDIPGYEGFYKVSSSGKVMSLDRVQSDGRRRKGRILRAYITKRGYLRLELNRNGFSEKIGVHQLVAMAFKGHVRDGYNQVVNHIDFNPLNNNEDNIEVTTQRDNANHKHLPSSSKYTGVSWDSKVGKYKANIWLNKSLVYLGSFPYEQDAHEAYERALSIVNQSLSEAYTAALTKIKALKP